MADVKADGEERRQALDLSNEAAAYLREGKPEKALPLLRRAVTLQPDDGNILLNLGGAYVLLGQFDEAVPVLARAAEVAPHEAMVWCNLGVALLRLPGKNAGEDQEKAIAAFERSLELDPTAPNVAYNLGLVYRDREQWAKAVSAFQRALQADPKDRDACTMLQRTEDCLANERRRGDGGDSA